MYPTNINRTVQGILFFVLLTIFRKSGNPIVVLTLFGVLFGTVLNVYMSIHNTEMNKPPAGETKQHSHMRMLAGLTLQVVCIVIMGIITWLLLQREPGIFKTLF